jgi:hypothetical protein
MQHRVRSAAALAALTLGVATVLLGASPATSAAKTRRKSSDTVKTGAKLRPGDSRTSRNGRYRLLMQKDGNLVLYKLRHRKPVRNGAVWSTQSSGHPGASAVMQTDANFVVYSATKQALYATGTVVPSRLAGSPKLVVNNDGTVTVSRGGTKVWSSGLDRDHLGSAQILNAGQSRKSPNGRYTLVMQADGNLVLYDNTTRAALWSSQTDGNPGAVAVMQSDANLVVYSAAKQPLYSTATGGRGDSESHLVIQDDGNAVIYDSANQPLWSSARDVYALTAEQQLHAGQHRRSPNGRYLLVMQGDGNLVEYDTATRAPLWSSNTGRNPGASATMQADGNLVVYSSANAPLFGTGTGGRGDITSRVIVQDDGNVVLYTGANVPLWSSQLGRH